MTADVSILRIEHLDLRVESWRWPFAMDRRAEIDAHFARQQRDKPEIWNGRVLVMNERVIAGTTLRGRYFETDYANFLAWRDWGYPPVGATDSFASAALCTADGAFLLGVMGAQSVNAGRIYFPCGTPDRHDVVDGRVDMEGSVRREFKEETGLDLDGFEVTPGWCAVDDGPLLALVKALRAPDDAVSLRARILANLARQRRPELADIRIVRGPSDFDPMMPHYVTAYLSHAWSTSG